MGRIVYTFRMISNEEEEFRRDYKVLADQTFFDLHVSIQENLGYDKSQMASFVVTNDGWEKGEEITLFDMKEEPSEDTLIMDKVKIMEICTDLKQRLLYNFDFFSDRCFFLELVEISDPDPDIGYPCCTKANGKIPIQIIIDDNNIDTFNMEEFDIHGTLDDDITFESIDDYEEF